MSLVRRYELLEKIGTGGMAEIHLADAIAPDGAKLRLVVKRIHPQFSSDLDYRVMFMDEARIAGALDHPNVVRVLDVGLMDDRLFIALEHVEGRDLQMILRAARAARKTIPQHVALYVTAKILRALDHAHNRVTPEGKALKLVHRDVTPQNVLVSTDGEVKVTDFGLAKSAIRMGQTVAGVIKGNVRYMAPEQVGAKPVDQRADIYAVGMILFALLCGKHPFEDESLVKAISRCLAGDVPLPSSVNPAVPLALEGIILQAIALDPNRRFATAAAFLRAIESAVGAADLVQAKKDLAELVRLAQLPVALPAGPRSHSIAARLGPLIAESTGEGNEAVFKISHSASAASGSSPTSKSDPAALPGRVLGGHSETITALTGFPDGKRLLSSSLDHSVRVWSLAAGREEKSLTGHKGGVTACAVSGDGAKLFSGGKDTVVRVWDAVGSPLAALEGHRGPVSSVAASKDGTLALSGGDDFLAIVWDVAKKKLKHTLLGHKDLVSSAAFMPDGRTALTGCYDGIVRVWSLGTGELLRTLESDSETDSVVSLAVSGDGALVATGGGESVIRVWDFSSGAELRTLVGHLGPVAGLAISPDLRTLVSGSFDCSIRLWDIEQGIELRRIKTRGPIGGIVLAPGMDWIAAAVDKTVTVFPL